MWVWCVIPSSCVCSLERGAKQKEKIEINKVPLCDKSYRLKSGYSCQLCILRLFQTERKMHILFIRGFGDKNGIFYLLCIQAGLTHISPSSVRRLS